MAKYIKQVVEFLFPEYQIKACVDERGFISNSSKQKNYATTTSQTYNSNGTQYHAAPTKQPNSVQLKQVTSTDDRGI